MIEFFLIVLEGYHTSILITGANETTLNSLSLWNEKRKEIKREREKKERKDK